MSVSSISRPLADAPKKVLIICYYWPPAGGPGVQRWLHFVKHLPSFGIAPTVYVPKNAQYPLEDFSLVSTLPLNVKVISQPIKEPYKWVSWIFKKQTKQLSQGILNEQNPSFIERFLRTIRGNFFIPDARISWVKPSVAFLEAYIKQEAIDIVISSGPPHSMHLIAMQLKEKLGVKWLADFRDPWTTIGYHKALYLSKFAQKKHLQLEKNVLQQADHIVCTSNTTAESFKALTNTPITVVTNGFEWAQHPILATEKITKDLKGFSLLHIGSLLSGRNPAILWEALRELLKENIEFKKQFSLHFVGIVSDQIKLSLSNYDLDNYANYHGYKPHQEAREFQRNAQLLLLLEINSPQHKGIIPAKLFEYMSSETPILGVGPLAWEVAPIVSESQTGAVFAYDEKEILKHYILQQFNAYKSNEKPLKKNNIEKYHRKELTEALAKILHVWGA